MFVGRRCGLLLRGCACRRSGASDRAPPTGNPSYREARAEAVTSARSGKVPFGKATYGFPSGQGPNALLPHSAARLPGTSSANAERNCVRQSGKFTPKVSERRAFESTEYAGRRAGVG